ncbi:MAG: ribonuclease III [Candidatus Zixiibacteriota bacterium]|nr:MAG: ribonuclease III [candidate division Zixibacteria bacterium]
MGFLDFVKNLVGRAQTAPLEASLDTVEEIIGYRFRDRSALLLALTHRSYHRQGNTLRPSNERLEYLGDSVLDLIIADRLYHDHRRMREGELTKIKAMLVNETTLSNIGQDIGLNRHILLSPEEDKLGGRERASIISDAFESVIGAVYLDGGFDAARDVVLRLIYIRKDSIVSDESQKNYKGELLELIQSRGNGMPRYDVVEESGPDHEKQFRVEVFVSGKRIGSGVGYSKKEAEQKAAAAALEKYQQPEE